MRKSKKNRYFHHIFVSPGDAPGAITLNVVWMEREFDAYKLSCCMCRSNNYRFWDTARYLWKNRHFIIPPCIRMVSLPDGEKISKICLFVLTWSTNVTDGRTARHCMTAKTALMHRSHRAVKTVTDDHAVYIAQSATHHRMFVCDGLQHGAISPVNLAII